MHAHAEGHLEAELLPFSRDLGDVGFWASAVVGMMLRKEEESVRVELMLQAPAV